MLRLCFEHRAQWLVLAVVSSVSACAVGSNDAPNQMLGGGGPQANAGASTAGSMSSGGSGGSSSQGGVAGASHGGFTYIAGAGNGGMTAAAGTPATGGNPSGGTLGASGTGGTNAGGTNAAGTNAGGTNAGGTNAGGTNAGGTNAGGTNAGGTNAGGTSSAGSSNGGSGPVVVYARDYQFTSDTSPFGLSQYGSTPNIGMAGGPEKLSAQSTLSQTSAFGSPQKGSAQLVIPFSQYGEQLDFNSGFDGAREDWTGYQANARIKIISGGNGDASCPLQAWIYITATNNYDFGRGTTVNITGTWQDMTYNFAVPAEGNPDLTAVNQLGIQVYSNDNTNCAGTPSFSKTTIVIDNFQVHKP